MQKHSLLFKLIVKLNELSKVEDLEFVLNYANKKEREDTDKSKLVEFSKIASLNDEDKIQHYEYLLNNVNGIFLNLQDIAFRYKNLVLRIKFDFSHNSLPIGFERFLYFESNLLVKFKYVSEKHYTFLQPIIFFILDINDDKDFDELIKLLSIAEFKTKQDLLDF